MKTREEAIQTAKDMYGMLDLKRMGKNTHAWNLKDGKIYDFHQQDGLVKDPHNYVSESTILQDLQGNKK